MDINTVLQDDRFQALPEQERLKVVDGVLAADSNFAALPKEEQAKVRSKVYVRSGDAKEALPTEILGFKVPKEVAATAVGWGHGMQATEQGIAQLLGSKTAKDDEVAFRRLEADQMVGNFAKAGDVGGTITAPENLVIPGAIGKGLWGMAKAGAVVGGVAGGLAPTVEGEDRLKNAAVGAAVASVGNLAVGALFNVFRGINGKELIPWGGKEMSKANRDAVLAANPGLTERTLQEIIDHNFGIDNAKEIAAKTVAAHPDAKIEWLSGKGKIPPEFRAAMKDKDVKAAMTETLARREDVKASITDDHEMYQFLQREAETAVSVRDAADAERRLLAANPPIPEKIRLSVGEELRPTPEGRLVPKEPTPARERTLEEIRKDAAGKPGFMLDASEKIVLGEGRKPLWIPEGMRGAVSQALLQRMAAAGVGGGVGAYLDPDNPLQGAIFGIAAGLGGYEGLRLAGKGFGKLKEIAMPKDERLRIDAITDKRDGNIVAWQRETDKRVRAINDLSKDTTRDRDLYLAATGEAPKGQVLTPKEREAIRLARANMDEVLPMGLEAGVLKGVREDYLSRIVDLGPQKSRSEVVNLIRGFLDSKGIGPSTSTKTRFGKERVFETLKELEAAGYKLKTHNLGEIIGHYNASVINAIENKKMIEGLKSMTATNGDRMIIPTANMRSMPKGYTTISHPQLFGVAVHEDIAPSVKFIFDHTNPAAISKGVQALNMAIKRANVSFSLFHSMALGQAYMGAVGAGRALADIVRAPFGKGGMEAMVNLYRTGGSGDIVDKGIRAGLRIGRATEDVDTTLMTAAMRDTASVVDRFVPFKPVGKLATGVEATNKFIDNITWGHAHTGMKLQTFSMKLEDLVRNNAAAHAKNPLIPLRSEQELAKIAADFTNSIFGGLDYRRIAESVGSQWGRDAALFMLSPSTRRGAQILMFAPDWTLSTLRSMTGGFGKGSGLSGIKNPQTLADLHRQYLLRSAFYFATVGDALNYAFSGHHLWENKDPLRVDMGDGRTMQLSKHFTEPIHDVTNPDQAALNKMGVLLKQAGEQVMNKKYLTPGGRSPSITKPDDSAGVAAGKRLAHLVGSPVPIPLQQLMQGGPGAALSGFVGLPIYGQTNAERAESKRQAALTRMRNELDPEKRREKERKRREKERQQSAR